MRKPTPAQTPRERLEAHRVSASRALTKSLYERDVTQSQVARRLGMPPQKVQVWTDHERPEVPSIAHVAMMPHTVALDLIECQIEPHIGHPEALPIVEKVLAAHGKIAIDRPDVEAGIGIIYALLPSVIKESSDVSAATSAALVDGSISDEEAEQIERECDEAERVIASLRMQVRALRQPQEARGQA